MQGAMARHWSHDFRVTRLIRSKYFPEATSIRTVSPSLTN
ncbi:hypothetical protein CNECB9_5460008 [Cupriavidus necator]|uniref:Uncharacterized protein n=1 Tax=Cupriavidus necator TaxID=106590 RepID=A0A1K0IQF7_CUPNE|nr:hypothetical protein CNECB9_5460008 [Cupriavidus necator]